MLNEKLAVLISRCLSSEASSIEREELFGLLKNDPQHQYLFELLTHFWEANRSLQIKDGDDDHFNHILALAEEDTSLHPNPAVVLSPVASGRRKLYAWSASAAAVLITIAICLYRVPPKNIFQQNPAKLAVQQNEVKARSGVRSRLTLPDGTTVWLNADSRIIYGNSFNVRSREVNLEGEGFFEVAKNAQRPFIVHAAGIDIKALGTAFNVKSYPLEPTIETTLMRGSVEVMKANEPSGARVILQPYEKLVFTKSANSEKYRPVNKISPQEMLVTSVVANAPDSAVKETAWIYNRLFFDGDTFYELAAKMERWFNVTIQFRDEDVGKYRFKGVFKNETIEQALSALQLTADFKYSINGNTVELFKGRSE